MPEADLIYGWAAVSSLFTIIGSLQILPFTIIAIGFAGLSIVALIFIVKRAGRIGAPGAWRAILLILPMMFLAAAMIPSQWDDLTHWLPNARFLIEHDAFPNASLPKSHSTFPAYPYGVALITYLTSKIAGSIVENATSLFNILLVMSFGLLVARIAVAIAQCKTDPVGICPSPDQLKAVKTGWAFCALAILIATAFSPTYVTRLVLSSYADLPTTITVGVASIMVWLMLNAMSGNDDQSANNYAWQASLAITAAITLKQVNLVFLLSLLISIGILAILDRTISFRAVLRICPRLIILPFAVYVIWRLYVSFNISGGEHAFRPLEAWVWDKADEILTRMSLIASKKGGYFGVMTVATISALVFLRHPRTAFHRLTIICATMFLCYNGFLFSSYLGAFTEGEGLRAASYWRYNTHLGGVCLVFAACVLAHGWRRCERCRIPSAVAGLAIVLVFAAPIVLAKKFRFDREPRIIYARMIAENLRASLSPNDKLLLAEFDTDGRYQMIMRYGLYRSAPIVAEMTARDKPFYKNLIKRLNQTKPTHIWIYDLTPEITKLVAAPVRPNQSYLLERHSDGWAIKRSWPHPPRD